MKRWVEIDGVSESLELVAIGRSLKFRLGGQPEREAQVERTEPGVYSMLLEGRSYEARVDHRDDTLVIEVGGHRFQVRVRDPRQWKRGGGSRGMEGRQSVVAPMPGKVVRLLVAPGEQVEAGQGLVVVEAMKMQNEMKAARGGRVISLAVREGDTVGAGAVLATIE